MQVFPLKILKKSQMLNGFRSRVTRASAFTVYVRSMLPLCYLFGQQVTSRNPLSIGVSGHDVTSCPLFHAKLLKWRFTPLKCRVLLLKRRVLPFTQGVNTDHSGCAYCSLRARILFTQSGNTPAAHAKLFFYCSLTIFYQWSIYGLGRNE